MIQSYYSIHAAIKRVVPKKNSYNMTFNFCLYSLKSLLKKMLFSDEIHFFKCDWESNFAFFSIIQITNVLSDKNKPKGLLSQNNKFNRGLIEKFKRN
jgi:hypothetical protein